MRHGRSLIAPLCLLALGAAGCEHLTSYESNIIDAGPDVVPASCLTTSGCVECDPVSSSSCPAGCDGGSCPAACDGGSCASGCDGGDCDELPASRDPWPSACNRVELAEDFFKPPSSTRWGRAYDKRFIDVKSCGKLQWSCPPHYTIWAWLTDSAAAGLSGDALVETRLFPQQRGSWAFTLTANVTSDQSNMGGSEKQGRACTLERQGSGSFRLTSRVIDSKGTRTKVVSGFKPGRSPILQNWRQESEHRCRLLSAAGKPVTVSSAIEGQISAGGTVKLTLSNRSQAAPYVWFWIDYLRVFTPGKS